MLSCETAISEVPTVGHGTPSVLGQNHRSDIWGI
jgi:hypothetical protein